MPICASCQKQVSVSDGTQCSGCCAMWYHYGCIGFSHTTLKAIEKGRLELRCPCPNCEDFGDDNRPDVCISSAPCQKPQHCIADPCPPNAPCGMSGNRKKWDVPCNNSNTLELVKQATDSLSREASVNKKNKKKLKKDKSQEGKKRDKKEKHPPEVLTVKHLGKDACECLSDEHLQTPSKSTSKENQRKPKELQKSSGRIKSGTTQGSFNSLVGDTPVTSSESNSKLKSVKDGCPCPVGAFGSPQVEQVESKESGDYKGSSESKTSTNSCNECEDKTCSNSECDKKKPSSKIGSRTESKRNMNDNLTDKLKESLAEIKKEFEMVKTNKEVVQTCFENLTRLCDAVDNLSGKIDEIVGKVKSDESSCEGHAKSNSDNCPCECTCKTRTNSKTKTLK